MLWGRRRDATGKNVGKDLRLLVNINRHTLRERECGRKRQSGLGENTQILSWFAVTFVSATQSYELDTFRIGNAYFGSNTVILT